MKYLILVAALSVVGCAQHDSSGRKIWSTPTVCIYGHTYFKDRYGYATGAVYNNDGSLIPCNKTHGWVEVPVVD